MRREESEEAFREIKTAVRASRALQTLSEHQEKSIETMTHGIRDTSSRGPSIISHPDRLETHGSLVHLLNEPC